MCGHVGIFRTKYGENLIAHKALFTTMLYADYVRGKDSTGIAVVHTDKLTAGGELQHYLFKRALASYDFMHLPGYAKAMSFNRPVAMIGHNRAATRGSVSDPNSHPFEVGKIILAHNGTLTNKHMLEDNTFFDTDSENIAHLLDTYTVDEVCNKIEGAWALVWWNKEEKTLNFIRNEEREFWFTHIHKEDALIWASTENLLRFTAEHNKVWLADETKDKYGSCTKTEVHTLYTFHEGSTVPVLREIEVKEKPKAKNMRRNYRNGGYWDPKKQCMVFPTTKKEEKKSKNTAEELKTRVHIMELVLKSMVGSQIPFHITSSHAITDKKDGEKGNFLRGDIVPAFKGAVFPELLGIDAKIMSVSTMRIRKINEHSDEVWAGLLTGYRVAEDGKSAGLTVDSAIPFPQYNVEEELEALQEVEDEKKYEMVVGPSGLYIPSTDFLIMTQQGCSGCGCDLDPGMAEGIKWVEDNYPVCAQCVSKGKDSILNQLMA